MRPLFYGSDDQIIGYRGGRFCSPTWSPRVIDGCTLELYADIGIVLSESNVTEWDDQSINGYKLKPDPNEEWPPVIGSEDGYVHVSFPKKPAGGRAFLNNQDHMVVQSRSRFTTFIVSKCTVDYGGLQVRFDLKNAETNPLFNEVVTGPNDLYMLYSYMGNEEDCLYSESAEGELDQTDWHVWCYTSDGTDIKLYVDGVDAGLNIDDSANIPLADVTAEYNGFDAVSLYAVNGDGDSFLRSVVSYNSVLSVSNRVKTEDYLKARCGLQ